MKGAERSRARILRAAARTFRADGLSGSVHAVMRGAGLTHGGFYAHFPDKRALVRATLAQAVQETARTFQAEAARDPARPLTAALRAYLSRRHRDHPAEGCVLPALAAEVARQPGEVRGEFAGAAEGLLAEFRALMEQERPDASEDDALALLAGLVGALVLARATRGSPLSDRVLLAARRAWMEPPAGRTSDQA